jgi:hydroxymethylglutaryl-CoA lyase
VGDDVLSRVKLIECPREVWQGLPKNLPANVKAQYLRSLLECGFQHLDAVSFVAEAAMPQMADAEHVLALLDPPDHVEIIGVVVNAKGAERAVASGAVKTLAFPYSISPQFLELNQRQTPEDALEQMEQIGEIAYKAGLDVVAYVPMAFGNPYGDPWDIDEVVSAVDLLVDAGVLQVSLADTVGAATPAIVHDVVSCVMGVHDGLEIGVHLHASPAEAAAKIRSAYEAGCRRFDAVVGGLGGCPHAQDVSMSNLSTEQLLETLAGLGAELPKLRPLDGVASVGADLVRRFGAVLQ